VTARSIVFPSLGGWPVPAGALRPAPLLLLLAIPVLAALPSGYQGGGGDDWHYLEAARCWNASGGWLTGGACLPADHWQARWPLIAPMALAIGWFGESRASIQLVPLLYALGALLLFASVVERLFGRGAALAGGAALLFTPAFAMTMIQPTINIVEIAFLLGFAAAALMTLESGRATWAFAAGISLGLAIAARETALVAGLVAAGAGLFLPAAKRRLGAVAAAGIAVPMLLEMLLFAIRTGDPLRRAALALGHVAIPSREFVRKGESGGLPLFNPEVIAGWVPACGIDLHWAVNGPINLLVHPHFGFTLLATALLAIACGRSSLDDAETRRRLLHLSWAAGLIAFLLIYGLAIDPKPRMFLLPLCAVAAIGGALASRAWSDGRRVLVLAFALVLPVKAILFLLSGPDFPPAERLAAQWLAARPGEVAIPETTRRNLALVPAAAAARRDGSAPYILELRWSACTEAAPGALVEAYSFAASEPRFLPPRDPELAMCLYRRAPGAERQGVPFR
jgi:4-amino-4-deoxy-L-arabinose transferase-like glycosyltransferase